MEPFENILGKGKNADSPFLTIFSTHLKTFFFSVTFILSPANASNLDQSKRLSFGKELNELCLK